MKPKQTVCLWLLRLRLMCKMLFSKFLSPSLFKREIESSACYRKNENESSVLVNGHAMRGNDTHVTKRVMCMNVNGWRGRGRPKKRWMDCVTNDVLEKVVDDAMTVNRRVEEHDMLRRPQIRWDKDR